MHSSTCTWVLHLCMLAHKHVGRSVKSSVPLAQCFTLWQTIKGGKTRKECWIATPLELGAPNNKSLWQGERKTAEENTAAVSAANTSWSWMVIDHYYTNPVRFDTARSSVGALRTLFLCSRQYLSLIFCRLCMCIHTNLSFKLSKLSCLWNFVSVLL